MVAFCKPNETNIAPAAAPTTLMNDRRDNAKFYTFFFKFIILTYG
jgi:hypothetical protein